MVVALWIVELAVVAIIGPPPSALDDWLRLFRYHGLLGLLDSYLLDAAALAFLIPIFLALYVALGRKSAAP